MTKREPHLQNIPLRTELGRQVRDALAPPPDFVTIQVDFAALELRIMAEILRDEKTRGE